MFCKYILHDKPLWETIKFDINFAKVNVTIDYTEDNSIRRIIHISYSHCKILFKFV
jgi:hypothetical protein